MRVSCHCGQLTAEISDKAEPPMVVLCHCLDCQKRSGSPFGEIAYFEAKWVKIDGEASEYTRPTEEGQRFTHGFCPTCGSPLWARASKYKDLLGIMVGAFADPMFPRPARSVFERSKHHWISLPANMPRHPLGRGS